MIRTPISLLRGFQDKPELRTDPMLADKFLETVRPEGAFSHSVFLKWLRAHDPIFFIERHR